MEKTENRNQKKILWALLALLLLLIGSCTVINGLGLFKSENSMSVTEDQTNLPSDLIYSPNEQSEDFIGAENGEGEITYTLIRALDEKGIYVDYFSLLNDKSTSIIVAPNTPAGVYELLIRATASGDDGHKSSSKEFVIKVTVNKADSSYDSLPTPIEGLIYNGQNQNLVNPGSCSTGTIYYKVDDGEWSTDIPQAKDVGTYTVYYKVVGDKNHNDIPEQSFTVTIETSKVGPKPTSLTVDYDGQRHSINYTTPAHVVKSGDASGVEVGEYSATYTPEGNYVWNDGTNGLVTVTLTINRLKVAKPSNTDVVKVYSGSLQDNGYNKPNGVTMTGSNSGINAGTYEATYTPDKNYVWSDGSSDPVKVTLTINKAAVNKPAKTSVSTTYNGSRQNNGYDKPDGVTMTGKDSGKNAGTYEATYTPDSNHVWNDKTSDPVTVTLTINRAKLPVPTVIGIDTKNGKDSIEYDGRKHHALLSEFNHDLIKVKNTRARRNAGEYTITASLKNRNYEWADGTVETKEIKWTISPRRLAVPKVWKTYTYKPNYSQQVKECDLVNYDKNLMYIVSNEKHIDAGEYTITIGLRNTRNYCWYLEDGTTTTENQDVPWTINKAENPIVIDPLQCVKTEFSFTEQTVGFKLPENAKGEVTYEVKSARYAATLIKTDDISIKDDKLCLKPETNVGIYTVIVGVHDTGDDNYAAYDGEIKITLTVEILDYLIKFDGNGDDVTGNVDSQHIYTSVAGWVLNKNEFVRQHYDFDGWNTEADGSGKSFTDRQYVNNRDLYPYEKDGIITLYAQWKQKPTYDVLYIDTMPLTALGLGTIDWDSLDTLEKIAWGLRIIATLNESFDTSETPIEYGQKYGTYVTDISRGLGGYEFAWYAISNMERVTSNTPVTHVVSSETVETLNNLLPLISDMLPEGIDTDIVQTILDTIGEYLDGKERIVLISFGKAYSNTAYTVKHQVEKLNSAGYETFKEELRFGKTDAKIDIDEVALDLEGYEFLGEAGVEGDRYVKAGGSTIVLKYSRKPYTVTFNSRGGSDVEEQTVKFGGLVKEPEDPTPADEKYRFVGWFLDDQKFDFETKVKGDLVLDAKWELKDLVDLTVLSSNDRYGSTTGSGRYLTGDEVEIKAIAEFGYRFVGWDDDGDSKADSSSNPRTVEVIGPATYTALFEKINAQSLVNIESITYYASAGEVIDITKLFDIVYVDPNTVMTVTDGPLSVNFSGGFDKKAVLKIEDDADYGEYSIEVTVKPYAQLVHRTSTVTINVILEEDKYVVSFDANGGSDVKDQYVRPDETASADEATTCRTGYTFVQWLYIGDEGAEPFDFDTPITESIVLVAEWAKDYTVCFNTNGSNQAVPSQTVTIKDGYLVSDPGDLEPLDDNHPFEFWYSDNPDVPFDFAEPIESDLVLNAKWKDITVRKEVSVAVNGNGRATVMGPDGIETTSGAYEAGTEVILSASANSGNKFVRWNDDSTENTRTVIVSDDVTYTAIFEELPSSSLTNYSYKEYDLIKGQTKSVIGDFANLYVDKYSSSPSNEGVKLVLGLKIGVYLELDLKAEDTAEVGDYTITVTATPNTLGWWGGKQQSSLTYVVHVNAKVTFDSNGGSEVPYQAIRKGGKAVIPQNPVNGYKIFAGWHVGSEDGELFDFSTPINDDITLVAKWTTVSTADVTIDMNDGSAVETISVIKGEKLDPIAVTRDGFDFAGWHVGSVEGELFDFATPIYDDITLVAKWIEKEYVVFYDNNGINYGSRNVLWNTDGLTPESNPRSLNPLKLFTGWYIDEDCTVPYRNQKYADLAGYDDDVTFVTLYAGWYTRGLTHYTHQTSSEEGKYTVYKIKEDDDWYLVLDEFDIVGGPDADMFTISLDKKSISINENAEPGTYYVEVQTNWIAILRYLGLNVDLIYDMDFLDIAAIFERAGLPVPENIDSILDEVLQNVMIEWTVKPATPDEPDVPADPQPLDGEAATDGNSEPGTGIQSVRGGENDVQQQPAGETPAGGQEVNSQSQPDDLLVPLENNNPETVTNSSNEKEEKGDGNKEDASNAEGTQTEGNDSGSKPEAGE